MKTMKPWLAAVVLALGATTPALATTVNATDVFDPDDVLFTHHIDTACSSTNDPDLVAGQDPSTGACFSMTYTHDLTQYGFQNPPDIIGTATLDLYFYDAADPGVGNPESVRILIDLDDLGQFDILTPFPSFDVAAYLSDGVMEVTLLLGKHGQGQADFYFDRSVLNASFVHDDDDGGPRGIPEPASLTLFGGGLSIVVARLRARRARTQ